MNPPTEPPGHLRGRGALLSPRYPSAGVFACLYHPHMGSRMDALRVLWATRDPWTRWGWARVARRARRIPTEELTRIIGDAMQGAVRAAIIAPRPRPVSVCIMGRYRPDFGVTQRKMSVYYPAAYCAAARTGEAGREAVESLIFDQYANTGRCVCEGCITRPTPPKAP